MKFIGFIFFCSTFFSSIAAAQNYLTHDEALLIVLSQCDKNEAYFAFDVGTETQKGKIVRTGWTGGCEAGKLHGEGSLTFERIHFANGSTPQFTSLRQIQGLMIRGKQIGPWLIQKIGFVPFLGLYDWIDTVAPGTYRKEADGSFQHVDYNFTSKSVEPVAATGRISAAQVAAHMQAAKVALMTGVAATKTPFNSKLLDDLSVGGQVFKAESSKLDKIRNKNVTLIFSSNTLASFDRYNQFQQQVRTWAMSQSNANIRSAALEMANAGSQKKITDEILGLLKERFANVNVASDFSEVNKATTDYIIVFDITFKLDADAMLAEQVARSHKSSDELKARKNNDVAVTLAAGSSYLIMNNNRDVIRSHVVKETNMLMPLAEKACCENNENAKQIMGLIYAFKNSAELLKLFYDGQITQIAGNTRMDNSYAASFSLRFTLDGKN